jgi:hypothetical protein
VAAGKRKTKASMPIAQGAAAPPFPVDMGRTVPVDVKTASAEEIVFTLSDGTRLRVRPVVMAVERSVSMHTPAGDPMYQFNIGMMVVTSVPKKLRKTARGRKG